MRALWVCEHPLGERDIMFSFWFLSKSANLLVRVKLGYPPNFNFLGKPLLGEKYVHGKRRKKNNAKFSGHYVYPRTETVCAHALRSHQNPDK